MDIVSQIFAAGLVLSQIVTAPDDVKTRFDPQTDQLRVATLMRGGCSHFRKTFDIEDVNLDDLIATAMEDPDALVPDAKVFRGLDLNALLAAYRQFCRTGDTVQQTPIDLTGAIEYYNKAAENLPDVTLLTKQKRFGSGTIFNQAGAPVGDIFLGNERRVWVSIDEIPLQVRQAFVAAEDKRFFTHKGIDEQGLVRAFVGNMVQPGRAQGGSTITQQVVKNVLVGSDVTFERKIREMILASEVEHTLSKNQILEAYLNTIYLGRRSWGIEMAARSYFGKSVGSLTVAEAALLAALAKGPNYFDPDRYPARVTERVDYVLKRMQEDGYIDAPPPENPLTALIPQGSAAPGLAANYVLDQIIRETKAVPNIDAQAGDDYAVRSTLNSALQRSVEGTLQEALSRYERENGRVEAPAAITNIAAAVAAGDPARPDSAGGPGHGTAVPPPWQVALAGLKLPQSDVQWERAVVTSVKSGSKGGTLQVGLADGRVLPLSAQPRKVEASLKLYDVVYVKVQEAVKKSPARADLRVRPVVQGAVVVLDNATGGILAMAGGFSYQQSQLNRVTQGRRQPGSSFKPVAYYAALREGGLEPTSTVPEEVITLPPISRGGESWTPKNYDGGSGRGSVTLAGAIAKSSNLATVNLLNGSIRDTPQASLDYLCELAVKVKLYNECSRYYPFILGAQPVRPIDLAAFYATIANEGIRPNPHAVATVAHGTTEVYASPAATDGLTTPQDKAALYQLKTMMQGVIAHGTAASIAYLAPYAAGKTGTSSDENDIWFSGFTNEVTITVWMGYDNADGARRTMGNGATGGALAVPVFEQVLQAAWATGTKKTRLAPPSKVAMSLMRCSPVSRSETTLPTCERTGGAEADDSVRTRKRNREAAARRAERRRLAAQAAPPVAYVCNFGNCRPANEQPRPWGFGERREQPAYQQRTYQQPAYQQRAYQQPAYQQPSYQQQPQGGGFFGGGLFSRR